MMKSYFWKALLIALFCVLGSRHANAQAPISITELVQLNFGTLLADPSRTTVTIDHNSGSITTTGATIALGGHSLGRFLVTGEPNADIDISFSSGDFLTGPDSRGMRLRRFRTNPRNNVSFDSSGLVTLDLGARLVIRNNQIGGAYSGTYTMTINYP